MNKGYFKEKQIIKGYNEYDREIKDDNGELLYTEHIKEPIIENIKTYVEYTNIDLLNNELSTLKQWYDEDYTKNEQKLRRLHTLGKLTDEGKDPYNELINLYSEAEIKRARIQELERLLSDTSK